MHERDGERSVEHRTQAPDVYERAMADVSGVAVTRAREDCAALATALEERRLRAVITPLLRFAMSDPSMLAERLTRTPRYDWLVCTSRHAVLQLDAAFRTIGLAPVDAGFGFVGAVGEETAGALEALGLTVHLRPAQSDAAHLARAMLAIVERQGTALTAAPRVLFPRAAAARDALPSILREAHWFVDDIACYETLPCADGGVQLAEALSDGKVAVVTLASGSAARAMASLVAAPLWPAARLVSIGPTTTAAATAAGLTIAAESPRPSMRALAETAYRVLLASLTHA